MIDKIWDIYHSSNFDFRMFSHDSDELSYLFEEWVPYYRMKYAICSIICPQSILEVGVRYGYSAITFLKASPSATYLGIDNDTDQFGGSKGAIQWAKKITQDYNANFLIADTQQMTTFPGEYYDLIHIDGQQDGDGTIHDLELALPKAKYILLDGYFWSKENMISASYFLEKYKQFFEYAFIIPSYAGELLIKTKECTKNIQIARENYTDQTIREEYDQTYFLQDCGGYNSFKRYEGKQLIDKRLLAAFYLASPTLETSILDIGCGRGELCYALAQTGANVTGIDYSPSAIAIANKTFHNAIKKDKLKFICDDFLQFNFDMKYDRIIATDFIEHIEKTRCDLVLQKVAGLLQPGGLFILHTSPNALNYKAPHEERRTIARSIGSYLPKNPRTYYEDVMHINEQTPDLLKTNLEKYFPYAIVWVATFPDIAGSLGRTFSMNETIHASSIFAVGSNMSIDPNQILNQLIQKPLNPDQFKAKISINSHPSVAKANGHFKIDITLHNLSDQRWVSLPPNPIHVAYHWVDDKGEIIIFNGIRSRIDFPLESGEKRDIIMTVLCPEKPGSYQLQISLVQESCFWFEQVTKDLPVCVQVKIQ